MIADLALHAEPMAAPPSAMRWVLPDVLLPVGRLLQAPGALGKLLGGGAFEVAWCEPHALCLRLGPGLDWREYGAPVRAAIREAVGDLGLWRTDGDRAFVLRTVAEDVLAGQVGAYVASHGGSAEVVHSSPDTVTVAFGGACTHCPALGLTLHTRVEAALLHRCPDLRAVLLAPSADRRVRSALAWPRLRSSRSSD
jgi:Fe-S cluster biogenesis protein NfuA